jgi:hypothetical protein
VLNTKKLGLRGDMNWTDVIILICICGLHVNLLRMRPVNMETWRICNTFRTATYKQNLLLRTCTLSIQCAVSTVLLHKPRQGLSKHKWLSDNVQVLQNLGSISKFKTPKWWHRVSNVLGARGAQILRPTIQNSDYHVDQAHGIYSALFFPLVNSC